MAKEENIILDHMLSEYRRIKNIKHKTKTDYEILSALEIAINRERKKMQDSGTVNKTPSRKVNKDILKTVCIILAAFLIFVGLPYLISYNNYRSGLAAMEAGDYITAVAKLDSARPFCSEEIILKAYRGAGDQCMSLEKYTLASEYYQKMGESGYELSLNALCSYAVITHDIQLLDELDEDPRAWIATSSARLKLAKKIAGDSPSSPEDIDQALAILQKAKDKSVRGFQGYSNNLNYHYGMHYLNVAFPESSYMRPSFEEQYSNIQKAYEHFCLCNSYQNADTIVQAIDECNAGNYIESARLYNKVFGDQNYLLDSFSKYISDKSMSGSIMDRLNARAGWAYLNNSDSFCDQTDEGLINCMKDKTLKREMYEHTIDSSMTIVVDSRESIISMCGSNPNGKILIITENMGYSVSSPTKYCAIDLEAMSFLPEKYYPDSLDEVEYVIILEFNYKIDGTYWGSGGSKGIQESAVLSLYQLPKNRRLYTSGKKTGPSSPFTITVYNGIYHSCYSGGKPDILQYASKAFEKIIALEAKKK